MLFFIEVSFPNIFEIILVVNDKKDKVDNIQIKIKIASTLWKNLPNSIIRVNKYMESNSSVNGIKGKTINKQITVKNKYIAEIITEVTAIFLKSSGFFSIGSKK